MTFGNANTIDLPVDVCKKLIGLPNQVLINSIYKLVQFTEFDPN